MGGDGDCVRNGRVCVSGQLHRHILQAQRSLGTWHGSVFADCRPAGIRGNVTCQAARFLSRGVNRKHGCPFSCQSGLDAGRPRVDLVADQVAEPKGSKRIYPSHLPHQIMAQSRSSNGDCRLPHALSCCRHRDLCADRLRHNPGRGQRPEYDCHDRRRKRPQL